MPKGGNSNWKFNFKRGAREELKRKIRATDAKEVGVENPAEETFRYPNQIFSSNHQNLQFILESVET